MKNKKPLCIILLSIFILIILITLFITISYWHQRLNLPDPPTAAEPEHLIYREVYTHLQFDESVSLSSYSNRDVLSDSENFPDVLSARYEIGGRQLFHLKHGVIAMFGDITAKTFHLVVENPDLVLYSRSGEVLNETDKIATGCYVEYKGEERFTIVSLGDLNGDGIIDDTDIKAMKSFIGNRPKNAEADLTFLAADINDSGNVTQYDIDTVLTVKDWPPSAYDLIYRNAPFDKNEDMMIKNQLNVLIKAEDYNKKMKSPKYYGSEVVDVSDPSAVSDDEFWLTLTLDREYDGDELRALRSKIELLDNIYEVHYYSRGSRREGYYNYN